MLDVEHVDLVICSSEEVLRKRTVHDSFRSTTLLLVGRRRPPTLWAARTARLYRFGGRGSRPIAASARFSDPGSALGARASVELPDADRDVVAAEAQGVREGVADASARGRRPGRSRGRSRGRGSSSSCGWGAPRRGSTLIGRGHQLDRRGGPQQVSDHRLGRGDRELLGVVAEGTVLMRARLDRVVVLGAGAVGVDVVDLARGPPRRAAAPRGRRAPDRRRRPWER